MQKCLWYFCVLLSQFASSQCACCVVNPKKVEENPNYFAGTTSFVRAMRLVIWSWIFTYRCNFRVIKDFLYYILAAWNMHLQQSLGKWPAHSWNILLISVHGLWEECFIELLGMDANSPLWNTFVLDLYPSPFSSTQTSEIPKLILMLTHGSTINLVSNCMLDHGAANWVVHTGVLFLQSGQRPTFMCKLVNDCLHS